MAATATNSYSATPFSSSFPQRATLRTSSGSCYIPRKAAGEDAHFFSDAHCTIGVAGGVGGWTQKGIDAGEYARELMTNAAFSVHSHEFSGEEMDPTTVLSEAFLKTRAQGSATACLVRITEDRYLRCLNVGDGGFMVVRGGRMVFRSSPTVCEEIQVKVQPGDVIVVATAGLFDNVFGFEIEELVNEGVNKESPEELAWRMAVFALEKAGDPACDSPFAEAAREAGYEHTGGKYNDITVVVSYVVPAV